MLGMTWIPEEPLPTMATRLFFRSTSLFQRLECHCRPLKVSRPGSSGIIGLLRAPVAEMRMSETTVNVSPVWTLRKVTVCC